MSHVPSSAILPVGPVLKEAFRVHWDSRVAFLVTVAVFAVLRIGILYLASDSLSALIEIVAQSPDASVEGVSMNKLLLALLFYIVGVGVTFVVWVRLTLLGRSKAYENSLSDWAGQIGRVTSILIFAGLVTVVAIMPITVIFNVTAPSGVAGAPQVASASLLGLGLFGLGFYFLACVVYAYFSSKLVEAALGGNLPTSAGEKMSLQAVLRLAIILFATLVGLFALGQVLLSIDQAMPGSYTMLLLTLAAFVLFSTYLSVVHAVAYRLRRGVPDSLT